MCRQAYFRLTLGRKMAVPALCFPKVQGKVTQNETTPLRRKSRSLVLVCYANALHSIPLAGLPGQVTAQRAVTYGEVAGLFILFHSI